MFGGVWNFLKRHRRKFFVAGVVVGGAVVLGKYAQKKLVEIQEKETAQVIASARRQHHFESNQRTCNMTVLSMLSNLREALLKALDAEALTAQLKERPSNKIAIWEELKILSFTRAICSVYGCCLLVVFLQVQLNVIGGYMYLDSALNRNGLTKDPAIAPPAVQHEYLENIHYLFNKGLQDLIITVRAAVEAVLKDTSLKQQISLFDVQVILNSVRKQVESQSINGHTTSRLVHFLLPGDTGLSEACGMSRNERTLDQLNKETWDIVESSDFQAILTICLDNGFTILFDRLADYFSPSENSIVTVGSKVTMPMAKLIPIMTNMTNLICCDAPNPFIQKMLLKKQVKDFAANVYETFSQEEQLSM